MHFNRPLWLCTHATDMRKSFTGLIALVKTHLNHRPEGGEVFVFINKNRTLMKCLYFEAGGYCLWCKRLEQGRFADRSRHATESKVALSRTEFSALIEGFDMEIKKRRKRYIQAE